MDTMDMKQSAINSIGFTVLYEPVDATPVADIVLIHGLQGSPSTTWLYSPSPDTSTTTTRKGSSTPSDGKDSKQQQQSESQPQQPQQPRQQKIKAHKKLFNRVCSFCFTPSNPAAAAAAGITKTTSTADTASVSTETQDAAAPVAAAAVAVAAPVYWPRDLLPADCPQARILVWGYDCQVAEEYSAASKSNLFSHAKELLYALERERTLGRPIIFVAHSLGGLLVKEILRKAQDSDQPTLQDILDSTKSVVFLGTPHRGSAEYAAPKGLVQKMTRKVVKEDTNVAMIRALSLNAPELELSRESFLQQWKTFNFQVKTFQESKAPPGAKLGILNDKNAPGISSTLDDARERAETLQGDNSSIAKFSGLKDDNYVKVVGELKRVLKLLPNDIDQNHKLSRVEEESIKSLAFSEMMNRHENIREALKDTCEWLYSTPEYKAWHAKENASSTHGLLWIKGKPGAGKSTLIKDAVTRAEQEEQPATSVASFFFHAEGGPLESTPLGLYRSILYQLCLQDPAVRLEFVKLYFQRQRKAKGATEWTWSQNKLELFLKRTFSEYKPQSTAIFIDAIDECEESAVRDLVNFLAELGKLARENSLDLRICVSSRHYPILGIPHCPEIIVEGANMVDIATYTKEKLKFIPSSEQKLAAKLETNIIGKASGIFLWAVEVLDLLRQDTDAGQPINVVTERLKQVPKRIEDLYTELLQDLKPEERAFSLRLFQFVTFAKSMAIEDLFIACLFSLPDAKDNLVQWGYEGAEVPPIERLVRFLTKSSRGLLEHTAGRVEFIHETAREFFVSGPGLGLLDPQLGDNPVGLSHQVLAMTYTDILESTLDWACLKELREYSRWQVLIETRMAAKHGVSMSSLLERLESPTSKVLDTPGKLNKWSVSHSSSPERGISIRKARPESAVVADHAGDFDDGENLSMAGVWFRNRAADRSVSSQTGST